MAASFVAAGALLVQQSFLAAVMKQRIGTDGVVSCQPNPLNRSAVVNGSYKYLNSMPRVMSIKMWPA